MHRQRHLRVQGHTGIGSVPWRRQGVLQGAACQVRECFHAGQARIQGHTQVHGGTGRGMDHGQIRGTPRR
eukprot:1831158-Alexandrium_andersonii.AAC.1